MSGHSKWKQIKHKKGAADAKRSSQFTKLAHAITIAAKTNKNLDLAVELAKRANMPKENIQRAIDRGTGKLAETNIEELRYELYGPSGIGIIVKILTDNKNRSLSELKSILNKLGGRLANAGAVSYLFEELGVLEIEKNTLTKTIDEIEMDIIDSGARDYKITDDLIYIYTDPIQLTNVKSILESKNMQISSFGLELCPKNYIQVEESKKGTVINLLTALEELDDVDEVYTNADI